MKAKKVLSLLLAVIMIIGVITVPSMAAETDMSSHSSNDESGEPLPTLGYDDIVLSGTRYYMGMEDITDKSQLSCEIHLRHMVLAGDSIEFEGEMIGSDQSVHEVCGEGVLFKSLAEHLRSSKGMTAVITNTQNSDILCFEFIQEASYMDLLPANKDLDGKALVRIALQIGEDIFYFEDALPTTVEYDKIYDNYASESNDIESISPAVYGMENVSDGDPITESDIVRNAEAWLTNTFRSEEIAKTPDNDCSMENRAAISQPDGLKFVPLSVFTSTGTWYNDKAASGAAGYYAVTTAVPGSSTNRIIDLVAWEYINTPCNDITSRYGSNGATGIKITGIGEYRYYKESNQLGLFTSSPQYKISECVIEMSMASAKEILLNVDRKLHSESKTVTVNWKSIIGLLPLGTAYSTAASAFNAIQYKDEGAKSGTIQYQDTATGQKNVYGKLVRGYQMTCNGHMLGKTGDQAIFTYTVNQPKDLSRVTGTKTIFNKYNFNIVGKNGFTFQYTDKKKAVTMDKSATYRVK